MYHLTVTPVRRVLQNMSLQAPFGWICNPPAMHCTDVYEFVIHRHFIKTQRVIFFCFVCLMRADCKSTRTWSPAKAFPARSTETSRSKDFFMSFVFLSLLKVCLSRCKYSIFIIALFCGIAVFPAFMPFMTIIHGKKIKCHRR